MLTYRFRRALVAAIVVGLCVGFCATGSPAAGDHYASPDGSAYGTGALSDPWDLATALAHPPAVHSGDTIWLRGGVYRGTFASRLEGSASSPIVVRQYPGERAIIDAAGATEGSALDVRGSWTWFWGFELTAGRRLTAVDVSAAGARFINLTVHQATAAFRLRPRASDTELYGNLIYDNGRPEFAGTDAGILAENNGAVLIAHNIVFRNFGTGVRIGQAASPLLEGNAIFENGAAPGLPRNLEVQGNAFDLVGNHTYHPRADSPRTTVLGGAGPCGVSRLANNTFADGVLIARVCDAVRFMGNRFLAGARTSDTRIVSHANRYDLDRQMLVVHNREARPSVLADAGDFLRVGDQYRLWRAGSERPGDLFRGSYDGKPIAVSMGEAPSEFGVFLLVRDAPMLGHALAGIPQLDLQLWLRADRSPVSQWADQISNLPGIGPRTIVVVGRKAGEDAAAGPKISIASTTGSLDRYLGGDSAEVLVYARALTEVERQSLQLALSAKYSPVQSRLTPADTGIPSGSLKLWLRADTGVTSASGKVSAWADQSGTGTNAAQVTATSQPTFIASAVNNLPALDFDGVNDFMTFNLPMTNLTGATIFLVGASTSTTQDGTWHGAANSAIFWNENSDWSTIFLTPYQKYVKYQFGTGWPNNISTYTRPVSLGSTFSVNAAVKNGANEALYVNGSLVFSASGKGPTMANSRPTGNLGRGYNDNTYFAGRIAEVLVYTRALTDTERQQVEAYLLGRYPATGPAVNQAPSVNAGADQTITVFDAANLSGSATDDQLPNPTLTYSWSTVSGPGTVSFANASSAATSATFSATGTYVLRLTANDGALSGTDDISVTVNPASPGTIPQQQLKLWLKADQGVSVASGKVSGWTDQSGSGTNAAQATGNSQPTFLASAFNGRPALQFDGVDDFLTFNLPLSGLTGMTIVLVSASTSATQDGTSNGATNSAIFWNETSDWCTVSLSPYQKVIRYHFGTGQAGDLPSYTRPSTLGSNYSTTIVTKNGANESLYVNGSQVYSAGNKVTTLRNVNTTGNLGRGYNNNTYFAGQIAEVLVYTKPLTDAERQSLEQYLLQKYPPVAAATNQAPVVNAGSDQTISQFQAATLNGSVTDDGLPGASVTASWSKVSGPGNVTFANPAAASTTATFSAAGEYTLRLSATDTQLSNSDDVIVTVNAPPPGSVPQQDLKLWLKADAGVTQANGRASQWSDQSGTGTNAAQAAASSQPLFLASAVNGKPALEFDGVDDFLTFTLDINNLNGMSVFLVSASTSSTQDGSWHGATQSPIFWNESSDWSTTHMSPYQRFVKFRFGTSQGNNLPVYNRPASIGSNFSVNAFVKNGATETLYIDGAQALALTGKLAPIKNTRTTGNLGRGYNDNTYFAGRIAEVLIYARGLSDAERQAVEQYLLQKYPPASASNQAPVVNAGADQSLNYPSTVSLNGTVTDDDLPNGTITTSWSKVSGPGNVTFANAASKTTTATFSAAGSYVLRLTASDGALSGSDDIGITLNVPAPDTTPPTITNVRITSLFSTSATVAWTTNEPADSQALFGSSMSYGSSTTRDAALVLDHSVTVNGLQPNTSYHFAVRSADGSSNATTSGDGTFTTPTASLITDGLVGHYSMAQAAGQPTGLNDLAHPEDMENWIVWENAAVVTPNIATAPNGTQTADKVKLIAPRGLLYHPFVRAAPAQTYTFSVYMRTLTGTYNLRLVRDNTDCWCGTASPTLTVTDTWQRFSLTFPTTQYETASSVGFGYEEITPFNLPATGEILVWGAQLEPGDAATPYPPMNGFPMRDQAVPDLSGRNNHGWLGSTANGPDFLLQPGSIWAQHDPARQQQFISFDGAFRWVQLPNTADLNLTTKGTWTVLARPNANWSEWAALFVRATGPGNNTQFALNRYGGTNQISFYTGNDNHPYRGGNLQMGVWSVITVTLDSGVLVGYIDGAEIFRFTNVPALRSISTDTKIGTFNVPPPYNYRGDIAAVLFYNRALSAGEVGQNVAILKAGVN